QSGSSSTFEIFGRDRTATTSLYDVVETRSLTAGGALHVLLWSGFAPNITSADQFPIVLSTLPITGQFTNVANGQRLMTDDGSGSFIVTYNPGSIVLSNYQPGPVPEPMLTCVT